MENDIRDIHGPISIPSPWIWLLYGIIALLVLAILYFLWRWYVNRRKARILTPYEEALQNLEKARLLMRIDAVKPYIFEVSEIVRHYIEKRFQVMATHQTTEEFLVDLAKPSHSPLISQTPLLEQFLTNCDFVKFGQGSLTLPEMEAMHQSALNFIQSTRPLSEAEESAAAKLKNSQAIVAETERLSS